MPDTYNVSGLTRKSSFYQTGDQKISVIKKSYLIQCVVKLQWCPGEVKVPHVSTIPTLYLKLYLESHL